MELKDLSLESLGLLQQPLADLVRRVGAFIRNERLTFSLERVEEKGLHDLVSYVDRTAEQMVVSTLLELTPGVSILGEEGSQGTVRVADRNGWQWVVDPLDGTTNFVHGMPPYAVSIGLVHGGQPVLGAIYDIPADELFMARKGGGATLNGQPIHSAKCVDLDAALIATGFPYSDYARLPQFMQTLQHFMHVSHGVRRLGSAAIDLAYVAAGRVDAFYEYGLKPWDVAAGIVIAQEAGVRFSDYAGGNDYLYGGELLCAGSAIFDAFAESIISRMKM